MTKTSGISGSVAADGRVATYTPTPASTAQRAAAE